ncbi:vacuolar sorting-associated protein (DUF946) [Rhynchospora pubera]|uniref:Vacuolar sorting-associated protein (DUF946) n=1 Tax=Rhynchospora pubera TaxID=906938 RepID=A0AAV8FDY2_9POAL|nr:vacuolar sorting-associated protein (DUF946) [Rhynchospora pubera]
MGNFLHAKKKGPLPIETSFSFPSPLPSWNSDEGFASGLIDIGGLELSQVSTFTKVWSVLQGGPDDLGVSFFRPTELPAGFFILGHYVQPNNKPLSGQILVGRDVTDAASPILKAPLDFDLIWSSQNSDVKQSGSAYFWLPSPPDGYRSVGLAVTSTPDKPSVDEFRCIRNDFTAECEAGSSIWDDDKDGISLLPLRPLHRGVQALGVPVGTFLIQNHSSPTVSALACLKNNSTNFTRSMPTLSQIQTLMQNFSPWIYLHPNEPYLPSSVNWFFKNGALLYQKDNQMSIPIQMDGSNLPQGGSNDGSYWIDLPTNNSQMEMVKKGDITSTEVYLHVKPMLGATCTDIAIWVFYPFNGPARAKVEFINISLGKIGEHVGDWEHVTLRISNFTGQLLSMYFSEHSGGTWVDASQLEFEGGNRLVAYSSLHGHAFYYKPGLVLQGNSKLGIGIRNDTAKGTRMDVGERYKFVSVDYLGMAEPAWLNYARKWGPKKSYDTTKELEKVVKFLPKKLKERLEKMIESLPDEVLGEEGPTGPKVKSNWLNDEQ